MAQPTATASPQTAEPGEAVTISGGGFASCALVSGAIDLRWDPGLPTAELLASGVTVNGDGEFSQTVQVPAGADDGEHTVSADCTDSSSVDYGSIESAATVVQIVSAPQSQPTLELSPSQVSAGDRVTATGDGYRQCTRSGSVVQLLWGESALADLVEPDGEGHFSVEVAVPDDAAEGQHTVATQCYDREGGYVTSGILAEATLIVVPRGSSPDTASSPPTSGSAPPTGSSSSTRPPLALIGGAVGGLLLLLLLFWQLSRRSRNRRRGPVWVRQNLRATAQPLGTASVTIRSLPGVRSASVGFVPHLDHLGTQTYREVTQ